MLTRALMLNILTSALVIVAGTLYVFMEMMEDGHMTARLVVTLIACQLFRMGLEEDLKKIHNEINLVNSMKNKE